MGVHTSIPMGTHCTCDFLGKVLKHHPLSGPSHGQLTKSLTTFFNHQVILDGGPIASREGGSQMR